MFSATKNEENARPRMLKSFFLSERKLLNAILRVSSSTWKMFLSHEMKCYLQCRRQIFMLELFLRAKTHNHFRASRTLMLCLVQLANEENARPRMLKSFFLQWEKGAKFNFKIKAQVHEDVSFSWNEMLFAMQKTDFHVLELFCRASHVKLQCTESLLELLSHYDGLVQLSKREMQGQGCWKASFSVRESC